MGFENRSAEIFTGQALNIAMQMLINEGKTPGVLGEDAFLVELFRLGKKVYNAGLKEGFLTWANK